MKFVGGPDDPQQSGSRSNVDPNQHRVPVQNPIPVKPLSGSEPSDRDISPRTSGTGASGVFTDGPKAFATEESPPGI